MTNQVTTYLKYANLQMAAEALYDRQNLPPETKFSGTIPERFLTDGNNRASKFTQVQAEEFSKHWTVVEHISNTATGFSGTLFKYTGATDEARGLVKDELVISCRSTEFIDDNVRDCKATNELEIKKFGWAFGQLADMEKWYADLKLAGKITGPVTVTGYSLGGHLATAFNLLRLEQSQGGEVAGTYTFNGAGVGDIKVSTSLSNVAHEFQYLRDDASSLITDQQLRLRYLALSQKIGSGLAPSTADFDGIKDVMAKAVMSLHTGAIVTASQRAAVQATVDQGQLLLAALDRVQSVMKEVVYVSTVTNSGPTGDPKRPALGSIAAARLDYQLAAVNAGKSTKPFRSDVDEATYDGYKGRNTINPVGLDTGKFFDIYGATSPSAVANSQPFIEREPLAA